MMPLGATRSLPAARRPRRTDAADRAGSAARTWLLVSGPACEHWVGQMRKVMRRGFSRQGQLESAAPLPHRSADDAEQESVSPLATDTDRLPAQTSASCTPGRSRRARLTSACGVAPPVGPHDQSDTDHDDPQPGQRVTNAPEPGRRPREPGNHYLLGAASMVAVQSLVTWSFWVRRSRG